MIRSAFVSKALVAFRLTPLGVLLLCFVLGGCAKKELEVDFRPLQIRWMPLPGETDESMPTKDNCVVRLTAQLMGEEPVQASPVEDLAYNVAYGKSKEQPEALYFTGVCDDSSRKLAPECKWTALCDKDLKVVVKFHNGD